MSGSVPEHPLRPLVEPKSIAVIGASVRERTLGHIAVRQALIGGLDGPVYPVNPRYDTILDTRCYPSLESLPAPVELAVLALGNERIEAALVDAIDRGVEAAVIFASAYLEGDRSPLLVDRLRGIARGAGIPICGANCVGFAQLEVGARATWFDYGRLEPGPIALITHSGTAYYSLAGIDPRLRYNLIVSPGQELVTSAADYLDYALGLESTSVVGLLLETVRDPERFIAGLERARERRIPVVALKVGCNELSARLAHSHSGALAGNDAAYEAVFEHFGVCRVRNLDEMSATLTLLAAHPHLGPGDLASVHDSGGLRGMIIDLAHRAGVPLAEINRTTTGKLARTLAYGLPAVNPVDAWGGFDGYQDVFRTCLEALAEDPSTAITVMFTDVAADDEDSKGYANLPLDVAASTGRPTALAMNVSRQRMPDHAAELSRRGVPVLDGAENAILAVKHAFACRDYHARAPIASPPPPPATVLAHWRTRLGRAEPLDQAEANALLGAFGIRCATILVAEGLEAAGRAAREIGYPVALKTAAAGVHHRSDVDGVRLALADRNALERAYRDLSARLGPRVLVSAMAAPGVELVLGIVHDEQFGPLVMIGAGGVLVEVLEDRRILMPPIDEAAAARALQALRIAPLLDGVRGRVPVDRDALYRSVARFGVLASEFGNVLSEVDVNPLIANAQGCMAVDALFIPRAAAPVRDGKGRASGVPSR